MFAESNVQLLQNYTTSNGYATHALRSDIYTIHWKFIGDEIEVVVQAKTVSWVGIGWKPRELNAECRRFPTDASRPEADIYYRRVLEQLNDLSSDAVSCSLILTTTVIQSTYSK